MSSVKLPPGIKFKGVKAIKPAHNEAEKFIGKTLMISIGEPEPKPVVVETIVGSVFKPTRFEINGRYHIVILDAYKQLNHDKSITPDMIQAFDEAVHWVEKQTSPIPQEGPIATPKLKDEGGSCLDP